MAKETEVKAKLTVDNSGAKAPLEQTKRGFENVGAAAKQAGGDGMSFIRQVASQALAFNAANIVRGIRDTASSYIDAAAGAQEARRSMAATAVVLEGVPWAKAAEHARESQAELGKIGLAAGFGGSEVRMAYNAILESTDQSTAAIARTKVELGQAAKIADAFGLNLEGAGREIAMMHEGTLRTKGQIFQMLRSTGVFGSDVHKASEAWMKMTDAERTKRMEFGLGQVAHKLEGLPASYRRLTGQVSAVFEGIKKDVGEPIVEALTPALQEIIPRLSGARVEIRALAKTMGPEIGRWVREGADTFARGYEYLKMHGAEIKEAISSAFDKAKSVVQFILDHKEAIAAAFGAKAMAPSAMGAIGAAKGVLGTMSVGAGGAGGFGGAGTGLLGAGSTVASAAGATGAAATLAASAAIVVLTASIVALGYAAWKLNAGLSEQKEDQLASMKVLTDMSKAGGDLQHLENTVATMRQLDVAAGRMNEGMDRFYQQVLSVAAATNKGKADDHEAVTRQIQNSANAIADAYRQTAGATDAATQAYASNMYANQAAVLVDAYNTAMRNGDQAAAALAATTIGSSSAVAQAFLKSTQDVEGGFNAMADTLMAGGAQFAGLAGQLRGKAGASTIAAPQIHMSGGQTFHVNQDFRNQDPDNVAVVFERDIGKLVQRRLGASTSSAFGT